MERLEQRSEEHLREELGRGSPEEPEEESRRWGEGVPEERAKISIKEECQESNTLDP